MKITIEKQIKHHEWDLATVEINLDDEKGADGSKVAIFVHDTEHRQRNTNIVLTINEFEEIYGTYYNAVTAARQIKGV